MRAELKRMRRSNGVKPYLLTIGLVALFLIIAGAVGLFVFDYVRQSIAASEMLPNFTINHTSKPAEIVYEPGEPLPRWEDTERVNVLMMGIDQRENEQGPWRTDTMLVLTIDPVTKSGGMLSIPRDLWVPIPGYDEGRINTAHYVGEIYDHPGGGPALAAKTVQYNLGVPIHYYARVNFTAFEQLVDLIGGIDIFVEEDIDDPTYPDHAYGYDPFHLPAGWQHLDGETALKYARTRHSNGGDFDRAKRQQQVILAVSEQVTRLDLLPQLVSRAPELWETLQDSVVTNLTLDQVIALAQLASEVEREDIRYGVIDEYYTQFWETPDKQQVLIPVRDRIREMRDYIFTSNAPLPQQTEDPITRLDEEAAIVQVMNGTTLEGLATFVTNLVQQGGLETGEPGNADRSDYKESLIIVYTGKTYTAEYLSHLLELPQTSLVHGDNPNAEYDIAIILGADYQPPPEYQPPMP